MKAQGNPWVQESYCIDSGKSFDNEIRQIVYEKGDAAQMALMIQNRAILERLRFMMYKQDILGRQLNRIEENM